MNDAHDIGGLLALMAALRTPETGCAWDLEQTFESIARFTIEEAYEVVDAIQRRDHEDLKDELGDLLLQVVFHARIAEERGLFSFGDVVAQISRKLIRRHPHVFGPARSVSPEETKRIWNEIKAEERAERRSRRGPDPEEYLGAVPAGLPALTRAQKLQDRASQVGFDWNDVGKVFEKLSEEVREAREAIRDGSPDRVQDEIGDLLFTIVNVARHVKLDAETALRAGNAKFEGRFHFIESALSSEGDTLEGASLERMEALWQAAKASDQMAGTGGAVARATAPGNR